MRASAWLVEMTGRDSVWWLAAVQRAVRGSSSPNPDNADHDLADTPTFLTAVAKLVAESVPPVGDFDPYMRSMAVTAIVAATWFGRVQYAKAHDPARPSSLRRAAYDRWMAWALALASVPLDERDDATHFQTQAWDFPFAFDAKGGDFV